jgi:hypothetical protein
MAGGLALMAALALIGAANSEAKPERPSSDPASYANALFQRVTGVSVSSRSPLILRMTELVKAGDYAGAARLAMADRRFYSVRMRGFATPYSNKALSPVGEFDDLQALFIGITRDNLDARTLLTGDFRYQGYPELGLPPVSLADNRHYTEFDANGFDPWKDLVRVDDQWKELDEAAGVLTTRAWAKAHYVAGTNRRAFEYTMLQFLCLSKMQWKDRGLPDDYVRRDITRAEAGNPATYQNNCRNCHAGMDAMAGAFARYDFVGDSFVQLPPGKVAEKYNINTYYYPDGYITIDSSWVNYLTKNHNEAIGWRGALKGSDLASFGKMISESKGFSQCLTKKLFEEICNRPPAMDEIDLMSGIADEFEKGGYRIRSLVGRIATDPVCLAHPPASTLTASNPQGAIR